MTVVAPCPVPTVHDRSLIRPLLDAVSRNLTRYDWLASFAVRGHLVVFPIRYEIGGRVDESVRFAALGTTIARPQAAGFLPPSDGQR